MNCENCGLPEWAVSREGIALKLRVKGDKWKRDSNRTVWCCSESCKWMVLAVAKMGPASHKWPVSMAEFTRLEKRSDRHETTPGRVDSKGLTDAKIELPGDTTTGGGFVTNRGGRPKKWRNGAERSRAYRNRKEGQCQLGWK